MNQLLEHTPTGQSVVRVTPSKDAEFFELGLWMAGIIPGFLFQFRKANAQNHFYALEQKINQYNSQISNYLEQRMVVLKNCAKLVDRAIALDLELLEKKYGSRDLTDEARNQLASDLESCARRIELHIADTVELRSHEAIREAMLLNYRLQAEISSARDLFNNAIFEWNRDIFQLYANRIVAAKNGYCTKRFFETKYTEPEDTFF